MNVSNVRFASWACSRRRTERIERATAIQARRAAFEALADAELSDAFADSLQGPDQLLEIIKWR